MCVMESDLCMCDSTALCMCVVSQALLTHYSTKASVIP